MGIEALAFSSVLPPAVQRERLSSSFQASTQGALEVGIPERRVSSFSVRVASASRPCSQTQVSSYYKRLPGSSFSDKSIIEKVSCKQHFSKCSSTGKNQLQWNPFLYGAVNKTGFIGQTRSSSSALVFEGNVEVASEALSDQERVGVLLLNLGGPDTLQDVQPFLFNLFADPDIIRLPRLFRFLQRPLAQFISVFRAPKSREGYAAIGGGSPLRKITYEQADALRVALEMKNVLAKVYVGMRYWHPFTEEAIEQIKRDRITKLVVLPLYPHFSISTSGSSIRLLKSIFCQDEYLVKMPNAIISSWYQRQGYIKAMANLIEKELQSFANPDKVMIFFSAHGVPVTYVKKAGDPYKSQMEESVGLIMQEMKERGLYNQHTLAYQVTTFAAIFSAQEPGRCQIWWTAIIVSGLTSAAIIVVLFLIFILQFNLRSRTRQLGEEGLSVVAMTMPDGWTIVADAAEGDDDLDINWITQRAAFLLILMAISVCWLLSFTPLLCHHVQ